MPLCAGWDGDGDAGSRDAVYGSAAVYGHEGPGATVPCGPAETDGRGTPVRVFALVSHTLVQSSFLIDCVFAESVWSSSSACWRKTGKGGSLRSRSRNYVS